MTDETPLPPQPAPDGPAPDDTLRAVVRELLDDRAATRAREEEALFRLELTIDAAHESVLLLRVLVVLLALLGLVLLRSLLLA